MHVSSEVNSFLLPTQLKVLFIVNYPPQTLPNKHSSYIPEGGVQVKPYASQSTHTVNSYRWHESPAEIHFPTHQKLTSCNMNALLPVLLSSTILPPPSFHPLSLPQGKIWHTFQKCYYFNILPFRNALSLEVHNLKLC